VDLYPLAVFLAPIPSLAVAAIAYRSIYPRARIEEALRVVREYQQLRGSRSKRALKKMRSMEPLYREARSLLLKATLLKMLLVASVYTATSLSMAARYAFPAPARIPILTLTHEGQPFMHALVLHFLGYIYALVLLRDTLL
jgi:hypothetical protein